tara:strand:+ start:563 stop:1312 length:750 start_codon:yes stop_codon:yes gene_type:complete
MEGEGDLLISYEIKDGNIVFHMEEEGKAPKSFTYPLTKYYPCPHIKADGERCDYPLICYWKLDGLPPMEKEIVGRNLLDTEFTKHRFFETEEGQGFEYDFLLDYDIVGKEPKHSHVVKRKDFYRKRPVTVHSWSIFNNFNSITNLNQFFSFLFVDEPRTKKVFFKTKEEVTKFLEVMNRHSDTFRILKDEINPDLPPSMFMFNKPHFISTYCYGRKNTWGLNRGMEWLFGSRIYDYQTKERITKILAGK